MNEKAREFTNFVTTILLALFVLRNVDWDDPGILDLFLLFLMPIYCLVKVIKLCTSTAKPER